MYSNMEIDILGLGVLPAVLDTILNAIAIDIVTLFRI